uniref:Uncharacterized protein n=1 Tax=Schizaphis graminum TaxID=13262 RepID=A0A2S2NP17_SCHGA
MNCRLSRLATVRSVCACICVCVLMTLHAVASLTLYQQNVSFLKRPEATASLYLPILFLSSLCMFTASVFHILCARKHFSNFFFLPFLALIIRDLTTIGHYDL